MRRSGNFWPYGLPIPDHLVQMLNSTTFPVPQVWCDEEVLASAFSLTGPDGTYQDTGLSIVLPDSGIYLVYADVRGNLIADTLGGASAYIITELYNSTTSAAVANSERIVVYTMIEDKTFQGTATINCQIQVGTATTIKLYAKRDGASVAWTVTPSIESNVAGRTVLGYIRLQ